MNNILKPISKNSRIESVDALRGFALLGVIIANIPVANSEVISGGYDSISKFLTYILVDKKFITIFSILFGFGFHIQIKRVNKKNINFKKYFVIRMLLLFIIGIIHSYGIWNGDIIMSYAFGGLFLLLIKNFTLKKLLITAIIFNVFLTSMFFILNNTIEWQEYHYKLVKELPITLTFKRYLYINYVMNPWSNFLRDMPLTLVFTFGNMIIGFILGKVNFFYSTFKIKKRILFFLGVFGFSSSYIYYLISVGKIELNESLIWVPFILIIGIISHSLFYISLFKLLYKNLKTKKILSLFSYVGRTALSNYILQSFFYVFIFYHCSQTFQLFGKLTITQTNILALTLFSLQLLISKLWLKKYQQGPIEFLWKKISYTLAKEKQNRII